MPGGSWTRSKDSAYFRIADFRIGNLTASECQWLASGKAGQMSVPDVGMFGATGGGGGGRMRHALLVTCLLVGSLGAQTVPSPQAPPGDAAGQKTGSAAIRGRVVASDTGGPIRNATVVLVSGELRLSLQRSSGPDGGFEFASLPAGRFTITASPPMDKPMYLPSYQIASRLRPLIVELAEGQVLRNVNVSLQRAGAISGRVLDDLGEPVAMVRIGVALRTAGGGTRPAGRGFTASDDNGRFRVYGLEPGDYYVRAESAGPRSRSRPDAPGASTEDYLPTYYPGTTNQAEAPTVRVELGEDVTDVDIRMVRGRTFRVTGIVLDAQGRPAGGAMVMLAHRTPESGSQGTGTSARPDGTFEFGSLSPGDYQLLARPAGSTSESPEVSRPAKFSVSTGDVEGITLAITPGVMLRGRVVTDDGVEPKGWLPDLRVTQMPGDGRSFLGGPTRSEPLREDWTFQLAAIPAPVLLRLQTLGAYFLKAVTYRNQDITDTPTEFTENTSPRDLQIVISRHGAVLNGVVADDTGRPPAVGCQVILFAADASRRGPMSTRVRRAGAAEAGRFSIRQIPPGDYLVVALQRFEMDPFAEASVLEPLERLAMPITLVEDEQKAVNLRLVKSER